MDEWINPSTDTVVTGNITWHWMWWDDSDEKKVGRNLKAQSCGPYEGTYPTFTFSKLGKPWITSE